MIFFRWYFYYKKILNKNIIDLTEIYFKEFNMIDFVIDSYNQLLTNLKDII